MKATKNLPPSVGKDGKALVTEQKSAKTPFLFVNETNATSSFKIGGRQDIRSHVRKHAAKQFKQSHKAAKAALKDEAAVARFPTLAPRAKSGLEYNHVEGCEYDQKINSIPSRARLEYSKIVPTADNFSKAQASLAPAASYHPPSEVGEGNEVNADPTLPTTADDTLRLTTSSSRRYSAGKTQKFFCPGCGCPIVLTKLDETERRRGTTIAKRASSQGPFSQSHIGNLGSGRADPFLTFPVDGTPTSQFHYWVDHAITQLLPGLVPDCSLTKVSPMSKAWLSTSLEHPLVFHALVFAASVHLNFLRSSKMEPSCPQALTHKLIVIHKLKEIMEHPEQACREEVIIAILVLSSHEAQYPVQTRRSPFNSHPNSPLHSARWLNIYGNTKYIPEHMKAVMNLVYRKGGLEKLETYGLAELISGGDTVTATRLLTKPRLPPLKMWDDWMSLLMTWATSSPRLPVLELGRGFQALKGYCLTATACDVLEEVSAFTIAIKHYLDGEPAGLHLGALSKMRTAIQHRILSLSSCHELEDSSIQEPDLYEACRLTSLIYGAAVVSPIPNSYEVLCRLVQLQKEALEKCRFENLATTQPGLLLWILVLGAIAAFEKPEILWYVKQLASLSSKRKIFDWEEIEETLLLFLWLGSACGSGGRRMWSEVMGMMLWHTAEKKE